jgi:hypothetical protein
MRPEGSSGSSVARTQFVSFGACGWCIAFTNCPDVVEGLTSILRGWSIRVDFRSKEPPHVHLKRTPAGRYIWRSACMSRPALWDRDPPRSAMNVIRDVHDVFFDWFLKANPHHLCLHGAAVRIGDGLVCFPSTHKAGKSTLCVAFAGAGQTVYCDDVLPIEPRRNYGTAMGIAPILRMPLPAHVGPSLRDFVAARKGPANRGWCYVRLGQDEVAPFGEHAPISALVFLDRKSRGRAKLEPVGKGEMLKELILQNFADQVPPLAVLDRLMSITQAAQCWQLRFDRIADAVGLLTDTFACCQPSSA